MGIELYETEVNNLKLHVISTEKFKTNTIVVHIKSALDKEVVTKRALLPYILQSGTENLRTRQELRSRLDELYGATLSVDVSKKGENQILSFRMDITNEKFLQDKTPLLQEAFKVLAEILLKPLLNSGVFSESIVSNEKRNLKQRIQSIFDDKIRYANMRITEEMCKNEKYGISVWGYEEELDQITPSDLFKQYQSMLMEDEINMYIVGDVQSETIQEMVQQFFILPEGRTKKSPEIKLDQKEVTKESIIVEEQDIKQGKLHIGFRTNTTYNDDDYFAMQMFNGVFGGFAHSKLFMNVREKASLAYYASSRFESHKGILMVMSGIEFGNYDQAVSIIKEQLLTIQNGDITDSEIAQTKAVIKNQLLETVDVAKGYVELLYHNEVATKKRTIEDWLKGIEAVTKEDIIVVSKKIQLDTIYFLTGKGLSK